MENSIWSHGEHEPSAVGGNSGQRGAQPLAGAVINHRGLPPGACVRIKRLAVQTVFYVRITAEYLILAFAVKRCLVIGRNVIRGTSVRRPGREALKLILVILNDAYGIVPYVVEYQVTLLIGYFYAVVVR